jgi:hypothetical protein
MQPGKIINHTHVLNAPPNWDHERDGPCGALFIRREYAGGFPVMVSVWQLNDYERNMIAVGGVVRLSVIGAAHPPVSLEVVPYGECVS